MLETLLNVFFTSFLILAGLVASCYFWTWFHQAPTRQDETGFFRTSDGRRLAVHRYQPSEKAAGFPVILCHGLGGNLHCFDLQGAPSPAQFLKKAGRDVWALELRGSGSSDRPGVWISNVPHSWGFDDHLEYDVPAAIDYVLERTGAPAVHWVGHSMGGMLAEAYLSRRNDHRIASATAIGSPADFSKILRPVFDGLMGLRWVLRLLPFAPMTYMAKLVVPIVHRLPPAVQGLFHPPNIDPVVAKRIVAVGSPMLIPSELWLDLAWFLEKGYPADKNGEPYLKNLPHSTVPLLLISGSKDVMAPPASVCGASQPGYDQGERQCVTCGRDAGCKEDYGHIDLLIGKDAETEVYPVILDWLRKHDAVQDRE
ncbi:MAG: alpha/beta fold hydrolase [Desulfomonilaceae bacterium]|nr:alpha/beta fold hydrolase [Desulfomonilaceae bacterium]